MYVGQLSGRHRFLECAGLGLALLGPKCHQLSHELRCISGILVERIRSVQMAHVEESGGKVRCLWTLCGIWMKQVIAEKHWQDWNLDC
jgi:hypothetical protein